MIDYLHARFRHDKRHQHAQFDFFADSFVSQQRRQFGDGMRVGFTVDICAANTMKRRWQPMTTRMTYLRRWPGLVRRTPLRTDCRRGSASCTHQRWQHAARISPTFRDTNVCACAWVSDQTMLCEQCQHTAYLGHGCQCCGHVVDGFHFALVKVCCFVVLQKIVHFSNDSVDSIGNVLVS